MSDDCPTAQGDDDAKDDIKAESSMHPMHLLKVKTPTP